MNIYTNLLKERAIKNNKGAFIVFDPEVFNILEYFIIVQMEKKLKGFIEFIQNYDNLEEEYYLNCVKQYFIQYEALNQFNAFLEERDDIKTSLCSTENLINLKRFFK